MVIIILVIIVRCRRSSEWCLIPHWRKKVDGPRMRPAGPAIIASPTAPFPLYSALYLWCNIFFEWFYILESKPGNLFPPPHTHFSIAFLGFFFIFVQIGFDRLFPLHLFHLWSHVSISTYRPTNAGHFLQLICHGPKYFPKLKTKAPNQTEPKLITVYLHNFI